MSNELTALSTLAVEINLLNEQVEHHKNQAVIYAARTGVKLNEVKESLGNDKAKFVEWLKNNCAVKKSNAYNYIRLAKDMPQLLDSLVQSTGLPNLTQAIELLSAPEEVKIEVTTKIEAGEDVTVKEIQRLKKEAAELLAEKQAVQNDLLTAKKSVENYQTLYSESSRQRDELRDNQAQIIDAKVSEGIAKAITENQQAIAENKRLFENAQSELERLKRNQEKAIADGVTLEKNKIQTELNQILYQIEINKRDFEELQKAKSELDASVGAIAIHKETIKHIKLDLSSLTCRFADAFDTNVIPDEVAGEWDAIFYAVSKIKKEMAEWRDRFAPIDSNVVIGEIVN